MIYFNVPPYTGSEDDYVIKAMRDRKLCGDGPFTKSCNEWLEKRLGAGKALLTTSCTHATEMAALLLDIKPGDEVIMPAYTFVSTANAFVLRGAVPVFVDIRPDTMNMDEKLIEAAITDKTRAIVPVHYAGVCCEMDTIMDIARSHSLAVVEDAAQAILSTYKGRSAGTFGEFGCLSFHETKNLSMGEGGALLIRDEEYIEKAEVIREKGTNRSKFHRGQVDKYTWVDQGSSYLPGELNAAYLYSQFNDCELIQGSRMKAWDRYMARLKKHEEAGRIELPFIPKDCTHNAHMFYIKLADIDERTAFIDHMKKNDILTVFHYIPLHTAPAGLRYARFNGEDKYTTKESERLVRLPLYYGLSEKETDHICDRIDDFFGAGS